jgi:hypothetical protein
MLCEIRDSHVDADVNVGLLGCNTLKIQVGCSSKYKYTQYHNTEGQLQHLQYSNIVVPSTAVLPSCL